MTNGGHDFPGQPGLADDDCKQGSLDAFKAPRKLSLNAISREAN
jgi:hypothetical protein